MWGPGGEMEPKKIIMETEPAIKSVRVMNDGRIWVQSCYANRELPEGVGTRYDVFDSEGRFEKEVRVTLAMDEDTDYFKLLADGRFLWFRNMKSAQAARFAHIEGGGDDEDDEEEEPGPVQVILMERAR